MKGGPNVTQDTGGTFCLTRPRTKRRYATLLFNLVEPQKKHPTICALRVDYCGPTVCRTRAAEVGIFTRNKYIYRQRESEYVPYSRDNGRYMELMETSKNTNPFHAHPSTHTWSLLGRRTFSGCSRRALS